ncbi:MAG: hypothetical protein HYY20_05820 [Candidatus Tectomicrobia bacterium]|uniref:Uncharacterized protein n=1 Tax=Tectimicrobiota bacterium TaxID=2528274 RepID=A0A932CN00_UNCTE|nr:hypothetical protein [Candidatus Tectomicrobia bacterium]
MEEKGKVWLKLAQGDPRAASAALAALSFEERLELLLGLPGKEKVKLLDLASDSEALIRALPEQELFFTVQEIGKWDSIELLSEATAQQIRICFDLDCWRRDALDPQRALEWFMVLEACGEEKVYEVIQQMDPEFLVLFLRQFVRVVPEGSYGLDGFAPEDLWTEGFYTLDGLYYFEFLDPTFDHQVLVQILDLLFREDQALYLRLMEEAVWNLNEELEEEAFRWREGRLSERGFPELSQALELYQFVEPSTFKVDEHTRRYLPLGGGPVAEGALVKTSYYLSGPAEGSFFSQALRQLSPAGVEEIWQELVLLMNQALLADAVDLSALEEVRQALQRVHSSLNIGLEYLARGEPAQAAWLLQEVYLKRIFQVGFSLIQKLKRRAVQLRRGGPSLLREGEIAGPQRTYRRRLSGLCRRHPRFYTGIGPEGKPQYREFTCLADVWEMERLLEEGTSSTRLSELPPS